MSKPRDPDPDLMSRIRGRMRTWRAAVEAVNDERAQLNALVIEAKQTGHSYAQIREATGWGIATIQLLLAKAGYKEDREE